MAKRNYAAELKDLVDQAAEQGWVYIGNNTVRRMTEHATPEYVRAAGWWNQAEYACLEFLSFVFPRIPGRAPKVVYGTAPCPWHSRNDMSISYRRAVELLAEPIGASEVHDR